MIISLEEFKVELNGLLTSQDTAQLIIYFLSFLHRLSLSPRKICIIDVRHLLREVDYECSLKILASLPLPNRKQIEKPKASLSGSMTPGMAQ